MIFACCLETRRPGKTTSAVVVLPIRISGKDIRNTCSRPSGAFHCKRGVDITVGLLLSQRAAPANENLLVPEKETLAHKHLKTVNRGVTFVPPTMSCRPT